MDNIEKDNFYNQINDLRKLDNGWDRYFMNDQCGHEQLKIRIDWIISQIIGPRILDIGCAEGILCHLTSLRDDIIEIYGIDLCENILKKARELNKSEKIKFNIGFSEDLKFSDNYFDSVIMGEVLEHVYDEKEAIGEAYLVLKPGGKIIVTCPYKGKLSKQHIRIFNEEDIIELFKLFKSEEFLIDIKRKKILYSGIKR